MQAPYPADTRAKGWRFELDLEAVMQSDTWALAPAEVRPWLLMMWTTAWQQTPCGSLPANDEVIAAKIGATPKFFAKNKAILLRGWKPADDGRLYHDTIAKRVIEMLAKKEKDRNRQGKWRASHASVTRDKHGVTPESQRNDTEVTSESPVNPAPSTKHQAPDKGSRASALRAPEDVDNQVWEDWLELRKKKRAPVTETAVQGARDEAKKAGMTLEAFLRVWCRRGSQGLEASWLKPEEKGPAPSQEAARSAAYLREQQEHSKAAKSARPPPELMALIGKAVKTA